MFLVEKAVEVESDSQGWSRPLASARIEFPLAVPAE